MDVQCFQASCLLLIIVSSILSLPFPPLRVVPGPLSHSSNVLFSSDKNNWFYFALITKLLCSTLPCHIKYLLKKHISDSATILFIVCIYQPQKHSLSFLVLLGNSHYVAFSECRFPLLSVSAVSSASLTIFPVLYFKVFPSFFLLISSFFISLWEKKDTTPLFLVSEASSSVCAFKLYPISCLLSW